MNLLDQMKLVREYDKYNFYHLVKKEKFIEEIYQQLKKQIEENNIDLDSIRKKIKSNDSKYYLIQKKIKRYIEMGDNLYFCTWTIEDKNMKKDHNRKLKELYKGLEYIINTDYAPETNRKHYHGIIRAKEEPQKWEYGFCKFQLIKRNNQRALAKYIIKITAHALKEEKTKIIYSRTKAESEMIKKEKIEKIKKVRQRA